jgi:ribose/xylose/arabinose/galactoside ABC-type transport system permease subunit
MQIARGLALHITQAGTIPNLPDTFKWIGSGFLFPSVIGERLPVPVFLMVVIYLAAWLVLTRTTFGRYVYAIGGNEEAARLSGVPVRLVKFTVYVICGITAAIGAIILTARLATGSARYGEGYELYVIAAAVVGGTSLFGGEGKILGTLLGALFIAVVNNGLNLTGVSSYVQIIIIGLVILLAVLFDQLKKRLA